MYKNHYIAVLLGYLDVKDNEMYSRAPKFVIYEQKEFNKEKKKLTKLSSARSTVPPPPLSHQFGQLVPLFLNAENVNLSDIQNDLLSKILLK